MAKILRAFYIDNGGKEQTDVTTSVNTNGVTKVDSSLIPTFSTSVKLTPEEEKEIQKQAEKECNGANDQTCLKATKYRLNQGKLREKQLEQDHKVPDGPALAVITSEKGKGTDIKFIPRGKTIVTKDGMLVEDTEKEAKAEADVAASAERLKTTLTTIFGTFGGALAAGLYVLGILLTWKTFMGYNYSRAIVIGMSLLAGFFPGSGYLLSLGAWIYHGYQNANLPQ